MNDTPATMPPKSHKGRLLIAGQSLAGVALLAVWLWIVDLDEVSDTLRNTRWGSVLLAQGLGAPQAVAASVILIFRALSAYIWDIFGGIVILALGLCSFSTFRSVVDAQSSAGFLISPLQPRPEGLAKRLAEEFGPRGRRVGDEASQQTNFKVIFPRSQIINWLERYLSNVGK